MTTDERLENLGGELSRAKCRNRRLLAMVSLAAAVLLADPLVKEVLGQVSRTTRNLPWWERLLVEAGVFGTISVVLLGLGAVALLIKRITRRGTDNIRKDQGNE